MALESKLFTALTGSTLITTLASSRIYPVKSPQSPDYPHIVYTRVSGGQINGLSGYQNVENPSIQIDTFATSYTQAKTLSDNIHTVLDATTTFRAILTSDSDLFEDEIDRSRVSQDFSCINHE